MTRKLIFKLSGASNATRAHDVYCFGKLLLQLITGKLHLDASDFPDPIPPVERAKKWKNLNLPKYDKKLLDKELKDVELHKQLLRKTLDPSLIIGEDHFKEVRDVANVARACLDPKPSRRPQMTQVLKSLQKMENYCS